MTLGRKELQEGLKLGIKTLVFQEVRLLRLEQTVTPQFIMEAISRSIRETKERIIKLAKPVPQKERALLLKRMIRKAVDEEIDRAIELRKVRCVRCLHGRFYDKTGMAHETLPTGATLAEIVGCDRVRPDLRKACKRFVEHTAATSLEDYLNEITLLYRFREVIEGINKLWEDYLKRA